MSVNLSPVAGAAWQFFDDNGDPLTGGKLYTYAAGTTTPAVTYTSQSGATAHSNPIVLDAAGRVADEVWLTVDVGYKFQIKNANDVLIGTYDNIYGIVSSNIPATVNVENFTGNGVQTAFVLSASPNGINNTQVFINGVYQFKNTYAVSGATITFTQAPPPAASKIEVLRYSTFSVGTLDSDQVTYTPAGAGAVATTVQAKLRESVSVKDFGATGDGTTDDTSAFAAAIASLPGGGRIYVPKGWYRITATLMLNSGLEFYGDGCTNLTYGVPTNNERPSHIFIDSDTGTLFSHTIDVQMESVRFFDLSFGSRLFPNTTERGTSTGFLFSGSFPNDIKHMTFDRCQFSNFGGYAIRVYDPNAGGVDPDWNVCPVTMTDCAFYYNTIGIEFEADNADCWVLTNVSFFQNAAAFGINCKRSGFITLISCFGGGGTMVITSGTVRDAITMISCQFENAVAMLQVADTMVTQNTYRPITLISCIIEAPIILAAPCHLISQSSRYVNNIEVTSTGVIIDSLFDSFLNTTAVNLVAGSSVKNFLTNGEQLPIGVRGQIFNGQLVKRTAALPSTGTAEVGDISWITAPAEGKPSGWICVTAGSPGAWLPFGQASNRQSAVTPVGAILPYFVGEELLDVVAVKWYKSVGLLNTDWVALN